MPFSVCIALIHNNNQLRNDYIRPHIETLLSAMEPHILVQTIEISYQPEIKPHSFLMAFLRDIIYENLGCRWRKYRLLKTNKFLNTCSFIKKSLVKYILNPSGAASRWKKSSAIEVMVTDKHIRAWMQFLDTGADYLIVFEDDVIFTDNCVARLMSLLDTLAIKFTHKESYVDLGGGCMLGDLMIGHLETSQDASYRYYKKPVTNTACAYLMSHELVTTFSAHLLKKPWLRLTGIDWMMNSLFILMDNQMKECVCMHSDPTIFKHGTTTGAYVSWQAGLPN